MNLRGAGKAWCLAGLSAFTLFMLSGCLIPAYRLDSNFEDHTIDDRWLREASFPYSLQTVAEGGTNNHMLRFEWRRADADGTRPTLGSELKTAPLGNRKQITVEFDVYIADHLLPPNSGPVVLMQLHSPPDFDLGEQWRQPVTSLYYQSGTLLYTWRASAETVTPGKPKQWNYSNEGALKLGEPRRNAWNHFRLEHRFDYAGDSGLVVVEVNGIRHEQTGTQIGYNDARGPYLKLGLYCPGSTPEPRLVSYVDNIRLDAH